MEEEAYKQRYDRVSAWIDLDALKANMYRTREVTAPGAKIMAIIKADGYGHGAVPIAKTFDECMVGEEPLIYAYGVAMLEEALQLRKAGITKMILVLGYTPDEQMEAAVNADISLAIFTKENAKAFSDAAVKLGKNGRVHIKADTGMGRIGFAITPEAADEAAEIAKMPNLVIEGLFSHMAKADETVKDSARKQFERYQEFLKMLEERGVKPQIRHISNSASIMELPEFHMDMVRSGISTYGLYPSEEVDKNRLKLEPILTWKSRISYVKEVGAGFTVGYGSTFVSDGPMRIATIPAGYADGYPRALSNKGRVLIHGKSARILGRVCMDQFMVDVTEIPEAKTGDEVILVGRDGTEQITVEELAAMAGSFNYEFVCDISKRVPRIYVKDGKPVGRRSEFAGLM